MMVLQLQASCLLTNLYYVISQPVPGASNSRAIPMDIDHHQGWLNPFMYVNENFTLLSLGLWTI